MTHLGREALEERAGALVLDELLDHGHARDLVLEVGVLDAGLDDVERGGCGATVSNMYNGRGGGEDGRGGEVKTGQRKAERSRRATGSDQTHRR